LNLLHKYCTKYCTNTAEILQKYCTNIFLVLAFLTVPVNDLQSVHKRTMRVYSMLIGVFASQLATSGVRGFRRTVLIKKQQHNLIRLASTAPPPDKKVDNVSLYEKRIAVCRCWKSKKMPRCDGSHNEHNKLTGEGLGPCIVTIEKTEVKGGEVWSPEATK